MIQVLRDAFAVDETSVCLSETDSTTIQVYDCYDCIPDLRRCYIKSDEEEPVHFTLRNPLNRRLCFAAIDNCLVDSTGSLRCDFVIGNFKKLYFVEVKQVNTSKRRAARTDAILQLQATIEFLKNRMDLNNTVLIAVICLKAKKAYPLQNATRAAEMVAFKEQLNASLMEGQSVIFEEPTPTS